MSNVYSLVANVTGYKNMDVTGDAIPLTNLTTTSPGPLNPARWVPFTAPNTSAVGAGGGAVFLAPHVNTSFTAAVAPAPNKTVDANLPHITIEMPVYKESLKETM